MNFKLQQALEENEKNIEAFMALMDIPDYIFDKTYPDMTKELEKTLESEDYKNLIKEIQDSEEFSGIKDQINELLEELHQDKNLSFNKRQLLESFFESFLTTPYDVKVYIQLLSEDVKLPAYAHATDAGADIYLAEDVTIKAKTFGNAIMVKFAVAIPVGWMLSIRPRSGLSKKTTLRISNSPGTIDSGYRDEVGVLIDNIGDTDITLVKGDRIAQFVLEKVYTLKWEQVDDIKIISGDRLGGWGSTDEKE